MVESFVSVGPQAGSRTSQEDTEVLISFVFFFKWVGQPQSSLSKGTLGRFLLVAAVLEIQEENVVSHPLMASVPETRR